MAPTTDPADIISSITFNNFLSFMDQLAKCFPSSRQGGSEDHLRYDVVLPLNNRRKLLVRCPSVILAIEVMFTLFRNSPHTLRHMSLFRGSPSLKKRTDEARHIGESLGITHYQSPSANMEHIVSAYKVAEVIQFCLLNCIRITLRYAGHLSGPKRLYG
jgi:hypothetical protein